MKNPFTILSRLLCLLILTGTLSPAAQAQSTFQWEDYRLEITVPDDFKVNKNTSETFEMSGEGMELIMEIVEEDITLEDLEEATVAGAEEMELDEIDEATAVSSNGLKGFYVEGVKDGSRIMFAGMLDPRTQTNFFIAIVFDDEDKQAEKDAIKILNSIKRMR
ncbi:amidohydrolase family protein [Arundinibacter roseus]|uniref:DUF4252 domain-containing protein n=1 Tax=Arundinibacter roseus TaxID=2070510 RepID=A0A4R4KH11_9BACT|nr:hypothetical protein [Arundinibacter roseus]TDB67340.1 hypothetical protein EZE20_05155 [Arundinibacter roseus]